MKTVFSKKARPDPELLALRAELQDAQAELSLAYRRFDQAVDPELVESCVYHISAVKARCNYLIRAIKEHDPNAITAESGRISAEAQLGSSKQHLTAGGRSRSPMRAFLPAGKWEEANLPHRDKESCHSAYEACEDEGGAVWS